jgi:hypothetical protein
MDNQIDEMIDSMTPAELAALEGEIDKRAEDLSVLHYFERGRLLAREAVAEYEKTGQLPPVLQLITKSADEGPAKGEVDAFLDQCSEADLAKIESDLDSQIEEKSAAEIAAFYYKQGQEYARDIHAAISKEGAGPKPGFLSMLEAGAKGLKMRGAGAKSLGYRTGSWMREHPIGTAALGVGAGVVGHKLLSR